MMDAGTAVVASFVILLVALAILIAATFLAGMQHGRSAQRSYPVTPPPYIARSKHTMQQSKHTAEELALQDDA